MSSNDQGSKELDKNNLKSRIQNEATILYQNREQEGIEAFIPLIKDITNEILPYTTSGRQEVQLILQSIQNGVEAYKHSDMIGMADSLMITLGNIDCLQN